MYIWFSVFIALKHWDKSVNYFFNVELQILTVYPWHVC